MPEVNGRVVVLDRDAPWPLWAMMRNWRRIHAVRRLHDGDQESLGKGQTVCGLRGWLERPGLFTRLSAERCAKCCDMLGIPRGTGHPKNDDECRRLLGYPVAEPFDGAGTSVPTASG